MSTTTADDRLTAEAGGRSRFASFRPRRIAINPRHSRFVGMMKLFLPMLAAALIATVLAWPGALDKGDGFELSFAALQRSGEAKLTMVKPRYLGTDSENRPFVVTAASATQDATDHRRVLLETLQADLTLADGTWMTMLAESGIFHQAKQTLQLMGAVNIFSDLGYEFHAYGAKIDLAKGTAVSQAPVHGQGPFGNVRADAIRIEDKGVRIIFDGNVRMTLLSGDKG